jgi:hypothetical protein
MKAFSIGRAFALPVTVMVLSAACGGAAKTTTGSLTGIFKISAGECAGAGITKGSYFRMVQPGGSPGEGPFVTNGDSTCGDKTFTPLKPGADGGLKTGAFQPNPDPAFDKGGNAVASTLAEPQKWFAVAFALSTNQKDPQTGNDVAAPSLTADGNRLSGDLRAFSAAWNGQFFNQGSPKPDGSTPGNTTAPRGTYDASTKAFSLDWNSQIVGGPFGNFTGSWHLEGVFQAN